MNAKKMEYFYTDDNFTLMKLKDELYYEGIYTEEKFNFERGSLQALSQSIKVTKNLIDAVGVEKIKQMARDKLERTYSNYAKNYEEGSDNV